MFTATQLYRALSVSTISVMSSSYVFTKPELRRYELDSSLYHRLIYMSPIQLQSVSVLLSFILAMVRHPEIQRRAQSEVDQVVGTDRLPLYADRADLPYTRAILKEVLRCYPPVPAGQRVLSSLSI